MLVALVVLIIPEYKYEQNRRIDVVSLPLLPPESVSEFILCLPTPMCRDCLISLTCY